MLSEKVLDDMHKTALRILENPGIHLPYPELRKTLSLHKGVSSKGERVCLSGDVVEDFLRPYIEKRKKEPEVRNKKILINAGGHSHHFFDPESEEIREITLADLVQMSKFVDSLYEEGVRGGAPGVPQDVPALLQPLAQFKIGCENCRYGRGAAGTPAREMIDFAVQMNLVMDNSLGVGIHMISPLGLEGNEFENALFMIDTYPVTGVIIGSMPMMGATAPIFPIGAFVQAIAEVIGGFVIMKVLTEGKNISVGFGVNLYAFDMKYASMVYGSAEHNLLDLMQIEVNRYYGAKNAAGRFIRTMAKKPGIQATAEMAASAATGALAGMQVFSGGGLLSLDEVFSPEQLIIACEVRDYVQKVREGFESGEETYAEEIIRETVEKGTDYFTHPSTLENFRSIYWYPELFEHSMLAQWKEKGEPDMRERIRNCIRERIARHRFELDPDKKKALDGIYESAKSRLS